jgi:hypothetical protein
MYLKPVNRGGMGSVLAEIQVFFGFGTGFRGPGSRSARVVVH